MNILLTGGSGDVGTLLAQSLTRRGDNVTNLDVVPPKAHEGTYMEGSILERDVVARAVKGMDAVVHIAAWHGIHEQRKTPADFHDLNVTGTFNMLQAAVDAGVKKFIFISSTSVDDAFGLYGSSKLQGEAMVRAYAQRNPGITFMTLRPRAFVPSWNRAVYSNFIEWAAWFMKGAVHVDDFAKAVLVAIDHTPTEPAPIYVIDGAYDYTAEDLANWTNQTFNLYYRAYLPLAQKYGIDVTRKPKVLDIPPGQRLPGYTPTYTMANLLTELETYGLDGPPAPYTAPKAE